MTPLFYRYQKKASKFAQEFTASANNVSLCPLIEVYLRRLLKYFSDSPNVYVINKVAQEAISLVRTVRVYGTEKQEFKRQSLYPFVSLI